MTEWMIVAVFYLAGESVGADAHILDSAKVKTEEECKAVIPFVAQGARERYGVDTVAECRLVPKPPPVTKSKPNDKKSEVNS